MIKETAPGTRILPPPPAVTRTAVTGHGGRSASTALHSTLLPPFVARWSTPAPPTHATLEATTRNQDASASVRLVQQALTTAELATGLERLAAAIRQHGFAAIDRFAEGDDLARSIAAAVAGYRAVRGGAG